MAEKIVRVRRKRRIRPFSGIDPLAIFRRDLSPARAALLVGSTILIVVVAIILFSYGSKFYNGWREKSLLKRASSMLQQENPTQAALAAREVLQLHPDSLPAFYILA